MLLVENNKKVWSFGPLGVREICSSTVAIGNLGDCGSESQFCAFADRRKRKRRRKREKEKSISGRRRLFHCVCLDLQV